MDETRVDHITRDEDMDFLFEQEAPRSEPLEAYAHAVEDRQEKKEDGTWPMKEQT